MCLTDYYLCIRFCRETAKQFPLLILVNKADLCSPKDLQSLCATIEGMKFENCHGILLLSKFLTCLGVIPVVAERKPTATLETVPDKCSKCGSEDVSVRKARNIWMCNNCGYSSTLQASTWTQDDGFQVNKRSEFRLTSAESGRYKPNSGSRVCSYVLYCYAESFQTSKTE